MSQPEEFRHLRDEFLACAEAQLEFVKRLQIDGIADAKAIHSLIEHNVKVVRSYQLYNQFVFELFKTKTRENFEKQWWRQKRK